MSARTCHVELNAAALEERCRAQEKAAAKTAEEKEAAANAPNVAVVGGGARRDAGADLLCLRCRTGLQRKYDSDLLCLLR